MHGLVQLATRKWLEVNNQLGRWKQQSIGNLCAEFPTEAEELGKMPNAFFTRESGSNTATRGTRVNN
jgi:hypothetical protein